MEISIDEYLKPLCNFYLTLAIVLLLTTIITYFTLPVEISQISCLGLLWSMFGYIFNKKLLTSRGNNNEK